MIGPSQGERREVHYHGHVQGIGFRYTALHIARRHDVAGYVRNLADGRVRLVAEATAEQLDRFLAELAEAMSGYIRQADVVSGSETGEFSDFDVRF